MIASMIVAVCVVGAASAEPIPVPLDSALSEWGRHPEGQRATVDEIDGEPVLRIMVGEDEPIDWRQVYLPLDMEPGDRFIAEADVRGVRVRDGAGIAMSLTFLNAEGERIAHTDEYLRTGGEGEAPLIARAEAPQDAVEARLVLLLNGRGEGQFRNIQLQRVPAETLPPFDGSVMLIVTDEVTVPALVGFGAEDDAWIYNEENRARGADETGFALREERIEWMQPDYIRMFFWYNDWNPSVDGETFTWDTDNMQSKYRALDLYQRMGARVNVTGVEWAVENVWTDLEAQARSIGALLEHLIVDMGYTCVQEWTLTNEPNLSFARTQTFDTYVELHRLVANEIEARGLDVQIVGSDDGDGFPWFKQCVMDDDYFELVDLFASHFYFSEHRLPFVKDIFRDRIDLLESRTPVKPFIIAEFGLADDRMTPPLLNPYMEDYENALWNHATYIDSLNAGVAGIVIWCIHEMYYPGAEIPMNFGLWNFADRDWAVRPVYHSVAAFTRNTQRGDTAYKVESSRPDAVRAARVENTLFWANVSDQEATISLEGFEAGQVRILTEDTIEGDRETGILLDGLNSSEFTIPPKSFGYAIR